MEWGSDDLNPESWEKSWETPQLSLLELECPEEMDYVETPVQECMSGITIGKIRAIKKRIRCLSSRAHEKIWADNLGDFVSMFVGKPDDQMLTMDQWRMMMLWRSLCLHIDFLQAQCDYIHIQHPYEMSIMEELPESGISYPKRRSMAKAFVEIAQDWHPILQMSLRMLTEQRDHLADFLKQI